ncbi:MAG: hypothetical protein JST92_23390 [Deltaproteobacteria bacterium]|nr:hypothetical protein [Deltaproteobacteria bacterium]
MTQGTRIAALLAALFVCACSTAEDNFTKDRQPIACRESVPVCSTFASCILDDGLYTSGDFAQGASKRVIVRTTVPSDIQVDLFFSTEGSPGLDTEIAWYETGCSDRKSQSSGGTDIFSEAGADRIWSRTQTVYEAGDHLVEVFSDAQAQYLLRITVKAVQ